MTVVFRENRFDSYSPRRFLVFDCDLIWDLKIHSLSFFNSLSRAIKGSNSVHISWIAIPNKMIYHINKSTCQNFPKALSLWVSSTNILSIRIVNVINTLVVYIYPLEIVPFLFSKPIAYKSIPSLETCVCAISSFNKYFLVWIILFRQSLYFKNISECWKQTWCVFWILLKILDVCLSSKWK